jgi:hypothetical protein
VLEGALVPQLCTQFFYFWAVENQNGLKVPIERMEE